MARSKRLLVATKDKRPALMASPIVRELMGFGWEEPVIVAEALSLEVWDKEGRAVSYQGPREFNPKDPWKTDIGRIFGRERPDLLLVGLSSPINLEREFMAEARHLSIPIVGIDDNWNAFRRSPVVADCYLTVDQLGSELISSDPCYATAAVEVIGDMAADNTVSPEVEEFLGAFEHAKMSVVILATQKWAVSTDILEIGLQSLVMSAERMGSFVVIPRIHPGASADDGKKWEKLIDSYAEKLHGSLIRLQNYSNFKWNSDHLSARAPITIAATGTGLRAAAYNRRMPVLVNTPQLVQWLKSESGGDSLHPLSRLGAGLTLTEPCDLFARIENEGGSILGKQQELLFPVPFNPKAAATMIDLMVRG